MWGEAESSAKRRGRYGGEKGVAGMGVSLPPPPPPRAGGSKGMCLGVGGEGGYESGLHPGRR